MPIDLFGNTIDLIKKSKKSKSIYQKIKEENNYQKKSPYKNKICFTCINYISYEYHNIIHRKCKLIGKSNSCATDINKNGYCNKFKNKL